MNDLKSLTLDGLKWVIAAQIIQQMIGFLILILFARLLRPQDFGLMGMVTVFTGFAQLFTDLGLGSAIIYRRDIDKEHLNSAFWVSLSLGIILLLIFYFLAPAISLFYGQPILKLMTTLMAFNFLMGAFKVVPYIILQREMRFKELAMIEVGVCIISGVLALTLAIHGFGVWSLVVQSIISVGLSTIFVWFLSSWRPSFNFNRQALEQLLGYSTHLLGFNVLNYFSRNLESLFIGKFIGPRSVGLYTQAYSLMSLPIYFVGVLSRVMFPAFSSIQHEKKTVKELYIRCIRAIALVMFPLMLGLFVLSGLLVPTILGDKWIEMVPVLRILSLVGLVQSVGTTVGWIYTSQGRTDILFKWGVFSIIVHVVVILIGLHWGIIGVASAYALANYLILWYPSWSMAGKLVDLTFLEMLNALIDIFKVALLMAMAMEILMYFIPVQWSSLIRLIILILFGSGIYLSLVHVFKLIAYQDIKNLIFEYFLKRKNIN